MASPQTENGYTKISNELFDALIRAHLTGHQFIIVAWIARNSYGWNKKHTRSMGIRQMAKEIGEPNTTTQRAIYRLLERGIIKKDADGHYAIVKDYEKWIEKLDSLYGGNRYPGTVDELKSDPLMGQANNNKMTRWRVKSDPLVGQSILIVKKVKKGGMPPSFEEVRNYCTERGTGVDPERWFNHYEANGWRVGRSKMVNWQAGIRTWENPERRDYADRKVPEPRKDDPRYA